MRSGGNNLNYFFLRISVTLNHCFCSVISNKIFTFLNVGGGLNPPNLPSCYATEEIEYQHSHCTINGDKLQQCTRELTVHDDGLCMKVGSHLTLHYDHDVNRMKCHLSRQVQSCDKEVISYL